MATTTYTGRARRALLVKSNSTFWVCIGRTTAWEHEESPPSAAPGAVDVEEPIVFVKASDVSLCKYVAEGGDIEWFGDHYEFVDDDDAIEEQARFLYMVAEFHPAQGQPYGNFRQVGVYSNLVPATGHETETWLAPINVSDKGILEFIQNDVVTQQSVTRYERIPVVIEFR
jgi:hypothetical protein